MRRDPVRVARLARSHRLLEPARGVLQPVVLVGDVPQGQAGGRRGAQFPRLLGNQLRTFEVAAAQADVGQVGQGLSPMRVTGVTDDLGQQGLRALELVALDHGVGSFVLRVGAVLRRRQLQSPAELGQRLAVAPQRRERLAGGEGDAVAGVAMSL